MRLAVALAAGAASIAAAAASGASFAPRTYTVNSTGDAGDDDRSDGRCDAGRHRCTLRAAIQQANANEGRDTIAFALTGEERYAIEPPRDLPEITDPVVLDGYTQPGARPNSARTGTDAVLKVILDGRHLRGSYGLILATDDSVIRGLDVIGYGADAHLAGGVGILVAGTRNRIEGNFVGIGWTGTFAVPNSEAGIDVNGSRNTIGGGAPAQRNVVTGNHHTGIVLRIGASENSVLGNLVGPDRTGTTVVSRDGPSGFPEQYTGLEIDGADNTIGLNVISANRSTGIQVQGDRNRLFNNLIGPGAEGAGLGNGSSGVAILGDENEIVGAFGAHNVISGNQSGVVIMGGDENVVAGSLIGTGVGGGSALGNVHAGIAVFGGTGNRVEGNVVAGNGGAGVDLHNSDRTHVQGNLIGTDAAGARALPNGDGVVVVGGFANLIGGRTPLKTVPRGTRNVISGNRGYGVLLDAAARRTTIGANFIGTDAEGTHRLGNSYDGIRIECTAAGCVGTSGDNLIAANLISANGGGVVVRTSQNILSGNLIGTDRTGAIGLGNAHEGVIIAGARNTVGPGNVISANGSHGVRISRYLALGTPDRNSVFGNVIGLDSTGRNALGNGGNGVGIGVGRENLIGGGSPKQRNLIAANGFLKPPGLHHDNGIGVDSGAAANRIEGNFVGVDMTGTVRLPNKSDGIAFYCGGGCPHDNTVGAAGTGGGNLISAAGAGIAFRGATDNTAVYNVVFAADVGVYASGSHNLVGGNVIRDNTRGVVVFEGGRDNRILGNVITGNVRSGIDLGLDGPTPNDLRDADDGDNNGQNFPVLTVAYAGLRTGVEGVLVSTPNRHYVLEFFANEACHGTGYGEGKRFLGRGELDTDPAGVRLFKFDLDGPSTPDELITATATDASALIPRTDKSGTSEFSACLAAVTR